MRRPRHQRNVSRRVPLVKSRRIETRRRSVPGMRQSTSDSLGKIEEPVMDQRVVHSPNQARQGRKDGVVRYVLLISMLLVVIAFAVAYTLSV
jgi:hypothetical protein